jgi:S-adenosylmethionine decarboxylase
MDHLIGHVNGVEIKQADVLEDLMNQVAVECDFTVVTKAFYQFRPVGATGVLVLAESHFSAHTFPEHGKVYIDVFCCSNKFQPMKCAQVIERIFKSQSATWSVVTRVGVAESV